MAAAPTKLGTTTWFTQPNWIRAYIIINGQFLDQAGVGNNRHTRALLALSHELTHVRNRVHEKALRVEPVTSADYVRG